MTPSSREKWLPQFHHVLLSLKRSALNAWSLLRRNPARRRSTPGDAARSAYRSLCEREESIPLFSQAWWLDATAGEGSWDVALVWQDNEVVAAMPYVLERRHGFRLLTQPPLTQALGPWLKPAACADALAEHERRLRMRKLIDQLPHFDHALQNWHHSHTDCRPFQARGFQQTTRYTYIIEDTSNPEQVMANFEHAKLKNIRKARDIVSVEFDLTAEEFYENHRMTLAKQGKEIAYSRHVFTRLYEAVYRHKAGRAIAAFDRQRNLHCALFVVWDKTSGYDLISTIDPEFRSIGAASLLVLEAIRLTSRYARRFDFEGSMIEGVERSFRQFGAIQTPYSAISKTPSRLLRTYLLLRELKRGD